jgi:hypothetical protein
VSIVPSPADIGHFVYNATLGPPVAAVKAAVHVSQATMAASEAGAKTTLAVLDGMPSGLANFLTLPFNVLQRFMNVGFWMMSHLKLIFIVLLITVLLILASFLRTTWTAAHQRVSATVGGRAAPRSDRAQRKIWGKDWERPDAARPQGHAQGVVNPDGTLCVQGGPREANHIAKRSGRQAFARSRCRVHNGGRIFEVQ